MAMFPCDVCGNRYAGRQQTAYVAALNGGEEIRTRLRLCPTHFVDLVATVEQNLYAATQEGYTHGCTACGGDAAPYTAFVTYYATGEDRVDFYGHLCYDCLTGVVGQALFGPKTPLGGPSGPSKAH